MEVLLCQRTTCDVQSVLLAINMFREKKTPARLCSLPASQCNYREVEVWPRARCGGSGFLLNVCLLRLSHFQELKAESHMLPTQTSETAAPFARSHLLLISRTFWMSVLTPLNVSSGSVQSDILCFLCETFFFSSNARVQGLFIKQLLPQVSYPAPAR